MALGRRLCEHATDPAIGLDRFDRALNFQRGNGLMQLAAIYALEWMIEPSGSPDHLYDSMTTFAWDDLR
jgi:hypothetical protein